MATFTIALHDILGVDNPKHADAAKIGLDDYPIWDERYRGELNQKIMMRFWNREIGFETIPLFVHNVRRVMGEIMPYYNRLAATDIQFDPWETVNVMSESETTTDGTVEGSSRDTATQTSQAQSEESSESSQRQTANSVSRNVNSEHPQTRLNEFENYATSSSDAGSESESTSDGDASGQSTSEGLQESEQTSDQNTAQHTTGKSKDTQRGFTGNKVQLMREYRDLIIGVDNQILNELEVLFMGVWDADQGYTRIDPYPSYPFMYGPLF